VVSFLEVDDTDLVAGSAVGDNHAIAQLYDRYAPTLLAVASRMLGNKHSAEDLVHDVFIEVCRRASDYSPERGTVRTWLLMRLRSRAIDRLRSAARRRLVSSEESPVAEMVETNNEEVDNVPDRAIVRAAIDDLPDAQKRVLESAYFKGMSASEIAEQEDVPIGTVKSRLAAALRKLRSKLQDNMWTESS